MSYRMLPALKRDLRRALGLDRFDVRRVKISEKESYGQVAKSTKPVSCEECGTETQYFHVINDSIPYPWIWTHLRMLCHDCYTNHWPETYPGTDIPVPSPDEYVWDPDQMKAIVEGEVRGSE